MIEPILIFLSLWKRRVIFSPGNAFFEAACRYSVFDFRYYICSVPDVNLKSQHKTLFAFEVISRRPEKLLSAWNPAWMRGRTSCFFFFLYSTFRHHSFLVASSQVLIRALISKWICAKSIAQLFRFCIPGNNYAWLLLKSADDCEETKIFRGSWLFGACKSENTVYSPVAHKRHSLASIVQENASYEPRIQDTLYKTVVFNNMCFLRIADPSRSLAQHSLSWMIVFLKQRMWLSLHFRYGIAKEIVFYRFRLITISFMTIPLVSHNVCSDLYLLEGRIWIHIVNEKWWQDIFAWLYRIFYNVAWNSTF